MAHESKCTELFQKMNYWLEGLSFVAFPLKRGMLISRRTGWRDDRRSRRLVKKPLSHTNHRIFIQKRRLFLQGFSN
ncbi:hypothetical protein B4113_4063 [Geobacillus sp. B4113_201601]|nr:hypothetical protein B4113_4063 [Geobacillus sp. B4113_201601]